MGLVFGMHDGSQVRCRLPDLEVQRIRLSLSEAQHLHISEIRIGRGGGIRRLCRAAVAEMRLSSDNFAGPGPSSVERFLGDDPDYLETGCDPRPWVEFTLEPGPPISLLEVHNRSVLWRRARTLRVEIEHAGGRFVALDAGRPSAVQAHLAGRIADFWAVHHPVMPATLAAEIAGTVAEACGPRRSDRSLRAFVHLYLRALLAGPRLRAVSQRQPNAALATVAHLKDALAPDRALLADEVVIRCLLYGAKTATISLGRNAPRHLDNRLYKAINARLATPEVRAVTGDLALYSHGIMKRKADGRDGPTLKATASIIRLLARNGIRSFVAYGTLLGLVRDGELLPHDDDVDIVALCPPGMDHRALAATLRTVLRSRGLSIKDIPTNNPGIGFLCIEAARGWGRPIDVFIGWTEGDTLHLPMAGVRYGCMEAAVVGLGRVVDIQGAGLVFPDRPETFLERRYGPDWRTPDYLFRLREG